MSDKLPKEWATTKVAGRHRTFQPGFASGEKTVEGGVPHLPMNNIGPSWEFVLDLTQISHR